MKESAILGRPFFLPGDHYGVLLLHGFTGTPQCLRYPAKKLNEAGFSVMVPMLEGHGTHHKDLEKTRWEDWYESVEQAFQQLKSKCHQVMVAGLSMGGLLTLHLAYHHPKTIHAIGLMATPLFLEGFLIESLFPAVWKTPLRHVYKYQKKSSPAIADTQARRRYQTYAKIPVVSVANLLEFQKIVRQELKFIRQPAWLAHSLKDETVSYGNLDYLKATLASTEIQTLTLKRSNHVITVDFEKEKLSKAMVKFFKRYREN